MLAFKEIAHHAGAGKTVLLSDLLHRFTGADKLLGGFVQAQRGDVLHKAHADLFVKQTRQPGFGDKLGGGDLVQR